MVLAREELVRLSLPNMRLQSTALPKINKKYLYVPSSFYNDGKKQFMNKSIDCNSYIERQPRKNQVYQLPEINLRGKMRLQSDVFGMDPNNGPGSGMFRGILQHPSGTMGGGPPMNGPMGASNGGQAPEWGSTAPSAADGPANLTPPPPVETPHTEGNAMNSHAGAAGSILGTGVVEAGLVSFIDANPGEKVTFVKPEDPSIHEDAQTDIHLSNFLSRPALIQTLSWAQTDTVGTLASFNPWELFFNTTSIKNKLTNYAFLTCRLHVKVILNASPFLYGASMLNYHPLKNLVGSTIKTDSNTQLVPYSQKPKIWIYPQTSQGGEMVLPFFYHKNMLDVTVDADVSNMGVMEFIIYDTLKSANGATGNTLSIQIYAWAEDVVFGAPTTRLALQSSGVQDEYGEGPISLPASALAKSLSYLENMPVIGRYMRASSMIMGTIGRVASLFGYTNVPEISNVKYLKNCAFPHMGSPEISTPVEKLTLDPKNELCIDPRTVGLDGTDELTIRNIVTRESYLTSFTLSTADTTDLIKFSSQVTPSLFVSTLTGTNPIIQSTPMSYVSNLFQFWRGDISFRFKFICTNFHKGRVRITYDARGDLTTSSPDYVTVFNEVVDLGSDADVEIIVPYCQAFPWLRTDNTTSALRYSNTGGAMSYVDGRNNGTLTVRVINPLSAPVTSSTVTCLVLVRGRDNLEFGCPVAALPHATLYTIQSGAITSDEPTQIVAGHSDGADHDKRYLVNMGEAVLSLRTLLRRSTHNISTNWTSGATNAGYNFLRHCFYKYPLYYGYATAGKNTANKTLAGGTAAFNYANVTPYNWIAPMFIGQRGSYIWHFNLDTSNNSSQIGDMSLARASFSPGASDWASRVTYTATGASSIAAMATNHKINGLNGMLLNNGNTTNAFSALLPHYNQYRFTFTTPLNNNVGSSTDGSDQENYDLQYWVNTANFATGSQCVLHKYGCIGTDFNLFFFINCPSYQILTVPTDA